jgi:hypothetical protein
MRAMNMYTEEICMLDRQHEIVRAAEERSRLDGWQSRGRMAERVAAQLRRLADRIDGRQPARIWILPG